MTDGMTTDDTDRRQHATGGAEPRDKHTLCFRTRSGLSAHGVHVSPLESCILRKMRLLRSERPCFRRTPRGRVPARNLRTLLLRA